jgi:hypothetical protein
MAGFLKYLLELVRGPEAPPERVYRLRPGRTEGALFAWRVGGVNSAEV